MPSKLMFLLGSVIGSVVSVFTAFLFDVLVKKFFKNENEWHGHLPLAGLVGKDCRRDRKKGQRGLKKDTGK